MPEQPLIPDSVDAPLMHALSVLVAEACTVVTAARAAPLAVRTKHDASPVTAADEASEAILLAGLARLMPGVPVISEEQARRTRQDADIFAIVDPLDGTREFVAGRNEFTVNVAIVHRGVSVAGLIAAPARGTLWRGVRGRGAERLTFRDEQLGPAEPVRARAWRAETACAVASRSHLDAESAAVLARVTTRAPLLCGSALKFCLIAEGSADAYPRLAPTGIWDVAAGHALVEAAGGAVRRPDGSDIRYAANAESFLVPAFVACGDPALLPRLLR